MKQRGIELPHDLATARGIDDGPGANATYLVWSRYFDLHHTVTGYDHSRDLCIAEKFDSALLAQPLLGHVAVSGWTDIEHASASHAALPHGTIGRHEPLGEFACQPAVEKFACGIIKPGESVDQSTSDRAADVATFLDQAYVGSVACGRDGCGHARRTSAANHHGQSGISWPDWTLSQTRQYVVH
jgi:hypothetical protein